MHAAAWRAPRAAHSLDRRRAPRITPIVGVLLVRNFHASSTAFRAPEGSAGSGASEKKDENDKLKGAKLDSEFNSEAADGEENTLKTNNLSLRSGRQERYGSYTRRASKNSAGAALPPFSLPDWFWERNITCFGEPQDIKRWVDVGGSAQNSTLHQLIGKDAFPGQSASDILEGAIRWQSYSFRLIELEIQAAETFRREVASILEDVKNVKDEARRHESIGAQEFSHPEKVFELSWNGELLERITLLRQKASPMRRVLAAARSDPGLLASAKYLYSIDAAVYAEIYASFCGELGLSPSKANIKDVNRQDTLLMCLADGSLKYLDAVVQSVATTLEADVIRLDAEDLAQTVGEYLGEDIAWKQSPIAMLGYEQFSPSISYRAQNPMNDGEEASNFGENDELHALLFPPSLTARRKGSPSHSTNIFLQTASKIFQQPDLSSIMDPSKFTRHSASSGRSAVQSTNPDENWNDYKIGHAMDAIVKAADMKRSRNTFHSIGDHHVPKHPSSRSSKGLIIQISGYQQLNDHPAGYNLMKSLRNAVKRRWYDGNSVMIVGTTTGDKSGHLPRPVVKRISSEREPSQIASDTHRTIYVTPGVSPFRIREDKNDEVRDLNTRHVENMIRKLLGVENEPHWTININRGSWTDIKAEMLAGIWSYDWVRRVALTMLGITGSNRLLDDSTLAHALVLLRSSDRLKNNWAREENLAESKIMEAVEAESRIDMIKGQCTSHEKKLLGSVINPPDIHTTFADVRAAPETIEALQTLTSLSLIRPEAFSYGVLASDKIPGVLLYGPSGTGKTLLAKAVAKECGATMLEVSAAEINDMYVGEGERNVKALFSLAKKLAPCVVFIDEADSLFASRGGTVQRKGQREIINQFLKEWDGMASLSAFIMLATNRPFDLDDAVLRRVPRRLLVDLPTEQDREAILKIRLKDEILDESISLAELARKTPFYSGSDLKNVSVAAALACEREQIDTALKHTGEESYVYPPKRILRKEHFDKALEEIPASVSEDMSTLKAIRKFDEKYGDRKGRPKKRQGMGFGGTIDPEPDSEAARVRKLDLNV